MDQSAGFVIIEVTGQQIVQQSEDYPWILAGQSALGAAVMDMR